MRFTYLSALVLAASAFAQEVVFSPTTVRGTITQFYGKNPGGPATGTYYDTVKNSKGAQLTVNYLPYRRRAIVATGGTPFVFIPTKSKHMGYESTKETLYGHVGLAEEESLHLTVGRFSTEPVTSPGPVPYLAPAITADDESQVSQFWSLDTTTGVLTFLNIKSGVYTILPASLAPAKPTSPPEPVHLLNSYNTKSGNFLFNKVSTSPLPPCKEDACPL